MLIVDFETRSRADLKKVGTDMYCQDHSTEIICMAAVMADPNDSREWLWIPADGALPNDLEVEICSADFIVAHNARFDQQIWEFIAVNDHKFPTLRQDRWYCSSAQARVNGLPASLDDATQALDSKFKKNHAGARLISKLCVPDKQGQFSYNQQDLFSMYAYCLDDTRATKSLINSCRLMSPEEHADWLANERINDRGIKVDIPLATAASQYADKETALIGAELCKLTRGVVDKHTQNQRIKKWVLERVSPEVEKLTVVYKNGERKNSLAKDIRTTILGMADSGDLKLDDDVYNVIACLDESNMSSVSKFKNMISRSDPDTDRVHGAFMYAGASTLRYTSRGLQVHNFKRDCYSADDAELYRKAMIAGTQLADGAVMQTLGKLLRPALIPEQGNVLVVGDWSSIEGRGLPFLANTPTADHKLNLFKQQDNDPTMPDMYTLAHPSDRQIGKVKELSLGFGGGVGAFTSMARNYGLHTPEHTAKRYVTEWRARNVWAENFWNGLEKAAKHAIRNPLKEYQAGLVKYVYAPEHMGGTLMCGLPCGTWLSYPQARLERVSTPYGMKTQISALKANWGMGETEWMRFRLWRGLLAENATQAFCASLLRWAIRQTDEIILHCHDEIVLEVPQSDGVHWQTELQKVMETGPSWAVGLPLKAPAKLMTRYGK